MSLVQFTELTISIPYISVSYDMVTVYLCVSILFLIPIALIHLMRRRKRAPKLLMLGVASLIWPVGVPLMVKYSIQKKEVTL